jgi:predicted alpha/beta-fold hydrolase
MPPFRPLWPWLGGDLQTLRNRWRPPLVSLAGIPAEKLIIETGDGTGDRLHGVLHRPNTAENRPLVILIHGLTGSMDSLYIQVSAMHLLAAGYPVLRVSLRGAGGERGTTKSFYHGGKTGDLTAIHRAISKVLPEKNTVFAGFSLGGNMVLKHMAEQSTAGNLLAGISISAPIDLKAAQLRLSAPRNRIYHRHLLDDMKRERGGEATRDIETILDFDNRIVAPANGFRDAEDYYRQCSAASMLRAIRHPTLIIHAADDPWIPIDAYRAIDITNPALNLLLTHSGGHVGFHARDLAMPWHDAAMLKFLSALGE